MPFISFFFFKQTWKVKSSRFCATTFLNSDKTSGDAAEGRFNKRSHAYVTYVPGCTCIREFGMIFFHPHEFRASAEGDFRDRRRSEQHKSSADLIADGIALSNTSRNIFTVKNSNR